MPDPTMTRRTGLLALAAVPFARHMKGPHAMPFRNPIVRLSQLVADVITGGIIRTAASGARVLLDGVNAPQRIQFPSGVGDETTAGAIYSIVVGGVQPEIFVDSPVTTTRPTFGRLKIISQPTNQAPSVELDGLVNISATGLTTDPNDGSLRVAGKTDLGTGGVSVGISGFDWGIVNATPNASGNIVVNHNLGKLPTAVYWTDGAGNHPFIGRVQLSSLSSSQFTVTFRNSTTDALATAAAGGMTGCYICID